MASDPTEDDLPGQMLQQAAIYNNTDFLESLLQGAERQWIDLQDSFGRTALYTCVTNDSLQCGHMLLQAGADTNIACGQHCSCMTPLHKAALENRYQFVSILLQFGARLDLKDASGETAMDLATKNRSEESLTIMRTELDRLQQQKQEQEREFMEACIAGDAEKATQLVRNISEDEVAFIINAAHKTQNSLFHRACEKGDVAMVEFLLEHGAQCHVHPVTGHSPLHAACMAGNLRCAEKVLQKFPELGRAPTIDGTLPLHLACADGHWHLVRFFLNFPYPDYVKKLFKEARGSRMCRLGIAINARDGHGRSPLHLAVLYSHARVVELLLAFQAAVLYHYKKDGLEEQQRSPFKAEPGRFETIPPEVGGVEEGTVEPGGDDGPTCDSPLPQMEMFCPVEVDAIDLEGNSPLHLAVKSESSFGAQHQVADLLLEHGANPNKPLVTASGNTTAMMVACKKGDAMMLDLLLKYGARDEGKKAFNTALESGQEELVAVFLQHCSHADLEYKMNFLALLQDYQEKGDWSPSMESAGSITLKSIWPNVAVMLNWHGMGLSRIKMDWLVRACVPLNGRPTSADIPEEILLNSITRLDVSGNQLQMLPPGVFQLTSLKILNAENNLLLALPGQDSTSLGGSPTSEDSPSRRRQWKCSALEEINLYKNSLMTLPRQIFRLPSLRKLNASNNAIVTLPFDMWSAPALVELNLASNKLQHLPHGVEPTRNRHSISVHDAANSDTCSFGSNSESRGGSVPSTPRKVAGERQPFFSESSNSVCSSDVTNDDSARSSPEKAYEELAVNSYSHWKGRLKIKPAGQFSDAPGGSKKQSKLTEINLSRNRFETVPVGLACLAPSLVKLVLSHNKLVEVGSLDGYPAGLKVLDLSNNNITDIVTGQASAEDVLRVCYSPLGQTKQIRSRSTSTTRGNHSNVAAAPGSGSTSSLQSIESVASLAPGSTLGQCRHRQHIQLDRLRTLRLSHNKLNRLVLALESEDLTSSGEESQKSSLSVENSSRHGSRLGSDTDSIGEPRPVQLLFPNLSMLDVSWTGLTSLPAEMREQTQLTELKLCNNRLRELPLQLGMLTKLWSLDLRGCPVERSLQAVLGEKSRKTAVVLGYLKSIRDEATLYNRMKLMFVGVQGIGKTSLLNQLRKEGKASANKTNKNWAQRMGHSTSKDKDLKGENISTVGVDIGDLVLQRNSREVVFRTWDFGGQREYYATHQYFLSKRAIYLVVWKVTDGEKGVNEIHQWLVNIQARAPNSPVIIVGTHIDNVTKKKYPPNFVSDLQHLLMEKYVYHSEPEKCGLPRVVGRLEVSCKSRLMQTSHITDLVSMIWSVATEEMLPGNKGCKLLEQKVPASYVHLQDAVGVLAEERKVEGKDPVLHAEQYKPLVMNKMEELYKTSFRDVAELNQATQFLHENGVLLHYDDVTLQDIYFLDPQWLCDILANVVTIREINSLAKAGIMRTEDLKVLFKNAAFKPEDIKSYIIDLLNKFEVALLWDDHNLLIPSLLPKEEDITRGFYRDNIMIPVRGIPFAKPSQPQQTSVIYTRIQQGSPQPVVPDEQWNHGHSSFYIRSPSHERDDAAVAQATVASVDKELEDSVCLNGNGTESEPSARRWLPLITSNHNPATSLLRLYLMSYFPSGFWPRLITRLLGDESFYSICMDLYSLPDVLTSSEDSLKQCGVPEWKCWQTGLELHHLGATIVRLKEVASSVSSAFCDYRLCRLVIRQEQDLEWNDLNLQATSILEVLLPNESLSIQFDSTVKVVQPSAQVMAALLAKVVDHLDTLLEDWYPDLGARFIQNTRGMYLITRVVPCPRCILRQIERQRQNQASAWSMVEVSPVDRNPQVVQPVFIDPPSIDNSVDSHNVLHPVDCKLRPESAPAGEAVSGWVDSIYSGGKLAMDTVGTIYQSTAEATGLLPTWSTPAAESEANSATSSSEKTNLVYCYLVEQCLQAAQVDRIVFCPEHGNLGPLFIASLDGWVQAAHVAPDSVFQDIGEQYVANPDHITRGRFLGKGAFGAVYAGTMLHRERAEKVPVAIKMLQPVKPGPDASETHINNYMVEKYRWDKEPMKNACEAYLNARKELSILLTLKHSNIVPLLGVSLRPLSLILSLAPQGALNNKLVEYHRAGARLTLATLRQIVMQVALALEYLHLHQIIYRDLKSENVLVWSLPPPHHTNPSHPVETKLADYGVSRCVLPSGAKGLAGTPPFIAPEIIQHNGEETYTEKVDCFSFGMFMYELLVLKCPFEGEGSAAGVANIKGHVLSGGRPLLTTKDLAYPTHLLDLMTLCWSHEPGDRPSAAQIVAMATRPAFCHLQMAVSIEGQLEVTSTCSAPFKQEIPAESPMIDMLQQPKSGGTSTVWVATKSTGGIDGEIRVYTYQHQQCVHTKRVLLGGSVITYMCVVDNWVWCADVTAAIHIFSLVDYAKVLKFPATTRPQVKICCLGYSPSQRQVYVVLDNGRFILCDADFPPSPGVNYSPVKTESPGNGRPIHCLAVLNKPGRGSELWCGQNSGRIGIWDLHSKSGSLRTAWHFRAEQPHFDVVSITASETDNKSVWSYVYPGTKVYKWDRINRVITGHTDISMLIPEEDRTRTCVMEEGVLKANRCQVTALHVLNRYLYVGTTWGCLVVINATTMTAITVLRCHTNKSPYLHSILTLWQPQQQQVPLHMMSMMDSMELRTAAQKDVDEQVPGIVTVGLGYRDLVTRIMRTTSQGTTPNHSQRELLCLLSWVADNWQVTGYTEKKQTAV